MTKTYEAIGAEIGKLVQEKQAAYGDSFGKSGEVMRVLYPDGIPLSKFDDAQTIVRIVDKLFRIATDRDALGESPWRDIAGYALLSVRRTEAARRPGKDVEPVVRPRCGALYRRSENPMLDMACSCLLEESHDGDHMDTLGAKWSWDAREKAGF